MQKGRGVGVAYKEFEELRTKQQIEATCAKRDEALHLASDLKEQARVTVEALDRKTRDQSDKFVGHHESVCLSVRKCAPTSIGP
jgi:hypothetical protein